MRGGKRPGAGAPKGNRNGAKADARARRMHMATLAIQTVAGTDAAIPLAWAIVDAGFLPRSGFDERNTEATSELVYRWFFKMSQQERAEREARGRKSGRE